jgi:hypothetical protein
MRVMRINTVMIALTWEWCRRPVMNAAVIGAIAIERLLQARYELAYGDAENIFQVHICLLRNGRETRDCSQSTIGDQAMESHKNGAHNRAPLYGT